VTSTPPPPRRPITAIICDDDDDDDDDTAENQTFQHARTCHRWNKDNDVNDCDADKASAYRLQSVSVRTLTPVNALTATLASHHPVIN